MTRRLLVSVASVAAMVGLSLTAAAPAQAAVVLPAFTCNQQPTTNQHLDNASVIQNTFMRHGPDRSCDQFWTAVPGDNVTFHCAVMGADGFAWVYYTDHTPSPHTGWSRAIYLFSTTDLEHC